MRFLTILTLLTMLPAFSYGQSDLQKILQGVQQFQQQRQQQRQPSQPPPQNGQQGRMMAPVQGPNASGNQNRGDFDRNNFFNGGGSNFVQPGGNMVYPQNGNSSRNTQYLNGQIIYPNQNGMNGQSFPSGTIINGQTINNGRPYQSGTIVDGQSYQSGQQYSQGQGQITTRITYPEPPLAPKKAYSRKPISIRCADDAVGNCSYELITEAGDAYPYSISSGRTQQLTETTAWTFRYRPTPSSEFVSYKLRGGKSYEIRRNESAWQLYMVP